jgi:hypothetical protein
MADTHEWEFDGSIGRDNQHRVAQTGEGKLDNPRGREGEEDKIQWGQRQRPIMKWKEEEEEKDEESCATKKNPIKSGRRNSSEAASASPQQAQRDTKAEVVAWKEPRARGGQTE